MGIHCPNSPPSPLAAGSMLLEPRRRNPVAQEKTPDRAPQTPMPIGKKSNLEQSRAQGEKTASPAEVKAAMKKMDRRPFLVDVLLNSKTFEKALIDNGCLCYSAFNGALVRRLKLPRIPIKERALQLAEGDQEEKKIRSIT